MCVCIPDLALLFNGRKPTKGPTISILQGAKETITRFQDRTRRIPTTNHLQSVSDAQPVNSGAYLELDERGHRAVVLAEPRTESCEPLQDSIHVKYDVDIERQ